MNTDWIPIEKRLPAQFDFVLASIETDYDTWVEIVGFDGEIFQLPGRANKAAKVTAWMPIPKAFNEQLK